MVQKSDKPKIILTVTLVVVISFLHYFTEMKKVYQHIFYRELYFLPLILAGFLFGIRGGLVTSLSITALYLPFMLIHWEGFSPDDFGKLLEIVLFNIVAMGLGFLSDKRKAEEKAKIDAERRAKEQAESADRLKSDFLSIISHELRTPLVSIIGYNDLLLDGVAGKLTEEQVDALKKIGNNSKRLLELINAMLEFNRLEAKSIETKEVNIYYLIEEIKSETQDLISESGLNFVWRVESGLPNIHTDPTKLKLVLNNLINNALKFTEKGNIAVDIHKFNEGIEISVSDTGIGIAPENLSIIFEPFRQIESPLTRRHGGVGLGLYIVKRLLEQLNGSIKVKSEPEKGSTFYVWIPAQK
ncbi:MAG: sensor histidine kinase [Thermodesulfovibrionales bacterium]